MAAPTYRDIVRYANGLHGVSAAARDAFLAAAKAVDFSDWAKAADELRGIVQRVCDVYGLAAQTLAGQWYDYCERLATGAEPEQLEGDTDGHDTVYAVDACVDRLFDGTADEQRLVGMLQNVVTEQVRQRAADELGARAMQQSRGGRKVGFARVPVGDTCAYCVMLASRGFDYWSEKSASRASHDGCDCVVVPHSRADEIPGYEDRLAGYRQQYEDARGLLHDPSPELQARLDEAKARHDEAYARGQAASPWNDANRVAVAMRYAGQERAFRAETEAREDAVAAASEAVVDKPKTKRQQLEDQARAIYVSQGGHVGLTEQQAAERFDLLVDGNSDAELRKYISKHS